MNEQQLEVTAKIQILKPVTEVFDAIVDPAKMSNYFISEGTGKLEAGREIWWTFPEFETAFPIRTIRVEADQFVSFAWDVDGQELLVEIALTAAGEATIVTIKEKSMPVNEAGLRWLKGNTEGWANFLACLKAYLEYGINLRKGAFDFLRQQQTF